MIAAGVRSGLEETLHFGAVAVSDSDGTLVAHSGDIDRPFYLRSSAKPFQAYVSQESGAGLSALELAMASASHRGHPIHVALVESMLAGAGLDEADLRCPFDWPLSHVAARRLQLGGAGRPRRVWHNCSGKHAGFLRACAARGWPLDSYLSPEHPIQRLVVEFVSELGGHSVGPVGVDGCGVPVLRTTARAMSRLFARLAVQPMLGEVFAAMHRYPALVAANGEGDTTIAVSINAVAKGGAQGCLGVGVAGGLGVAVKSWDGLGVVANVVAVAALDALGELTSTARQALERVGRPPVLGGAETVGAIEPRLGLHFG